VPEIKDIVPVLLRVAVDTAFH